MAEIKKLEDVDPDKVKVYKTERPEGSKDTSVMNLEATVDTSTAAKMSDVIMEYEVMKDSIPESLPYEAQVVMQGFFSCFEKNEEVREGQIKDWSWGLAQCIESDHTLPSRVRDRAVMQLIAAGIGELTKEKYILLRYNDGFPAGIHDDAIGEAWIRFQPKLLNMVYQGRDKVDKADKTAEDKLNEAVGEIKGREVARV